MARNIFTITGEFVLNGAEKGKRSLRELDAQGKKSSGTLGKVTSGVGKGFATMGKAIGSAAIAGAAALGALTVSSINAASELEATNAKYDTVFGEFTGLADQMVKDFQKLTPASKASTRTLVSGFQDLLVPMGFTREAATGLTGEFLTLTGALTNFNSAKYTAEEVSAKFASALTGEYVGLKDLGIQTNKEAVQLKAVELGLAKTTEEVTKQMEAQALLAIAQEQSTDALAAYNVESLDTKTKMGLVKNQFIDMQAQLGTKFLPVIQELTAMLSDNLPMIMDALMPIMDGLINSFKTIVPLLPNLMKAALSLLDAVTPMLPIIAELVVTYLPKILEVVVPIIGSLLDLVTNILPIFMSFATPLQDFMMILLDAVMRILEAFMPLMPLILELVQAVLPLLLEVILPVTDILIMLIDNILKPILPILIEVAKILTTVLGAAFDALAPVIESVMKIFGGLIDFISGIFSGDWEKAWGGIVKIFSGIWEGIKNIFKAPINFIIGLINGLFERIGSVKIPDWIPGIGGMSVQLPQIPLLAKGTNFFEGGAAIVGEQGAELVTLPRGAKVTPADQTRDMMGSMGNIQINVNGDTSPSGIIRAQRKAQYMARMRLA